MGGQKTSSQKRRGGLELLRQVYDELYNQLGEDFSPAELLRAAQTLIDVTKDEYGTKSYQDGQLHPGYYSTDVDQMITNQQWLILNVEDGPLDALEDSVTSLRERSQSLKRLYNPDAYYHRG